MIDLQDELQRALGPGFTVEREISGGGMSRIFVVRDNALQRRIVAKALSPNLAATLSIERFGREILVAASLQQANIVPVLSSGTLASGIPYYTMPFVDGAALRERLNGSTVIDLNSGVKILEDISRALEYAHRHGVVHRDIKPENVLLSGRTAVVTDFGIAKAISASNTATAAHTLTMAGTSLGTPAYMPPEQATGGRIDQRSDIYSWGVVAYETLSGTHPFAERTTAQQLIAAHISELPIPLDARRDNIPRHLVNLIMSALEKDPDNRPQSAKHLLEVLENAGGYSAGPLQFRSAGGVSVDHRRRSALGKRAMAVTIALGIGAAGILYYQTKSGKVPGTHADVRFGTLAVLPFVNTSGNPQDEYFSDGLTDELSGALSKMRDMRVTSHTSAFSFKGKAVPIQQIAHALNVTSVVEGTVRRNGNRLRVTAQLTNAITGVVIWTDGFEREASDVFKVQDDLTSAIVTALSPALQGKTRNFAAESRGTENVVAYDLYLRGKYSWNKRSAADILDAINDFNEAVHLDPRFGRAYAALASSYALLPDYAGYSKFPPAKALPLTLAAASKALALDSGLAEPHAALGQQYMRAWRWKESEQEFLKALRNDTTYATAWHWYATWLANVGRPREAFAAIQRARDLDPLSKVILSNFCILGVGIKKDIGAEAACEADRFLTDAAMVKMSLGDYEAAAAMWAKNGELFGSPGMVVYCHAKAGHRFQAMAELAALERKGGVHPIDLALANLGVARFRTALVWLDSAVTTREPALSITARPLANAVFDPVRSDPGFLRILDRMSLTPYAKNEQR